MAISRARRRLVVAAGMTAMLGWSTAVTAAPALMPVPASVSFRTGSINLDQGLAVAWGGYRNALLERAVARFRMRLDRRFGMPLGAAGPQAPILHIDCTARDPGFLGIGAKEAYTLSVSGSAITLSADGPAGVLRGLATLLQLAELGPSGAQIDDGDISDHPRYAWRGLMIDTSRHFVSIEAIKRQIDAMEQVKLDVLHLHLADSQGFRMESRLYPRLQSIASHGQYYTQARLRDLVAYAGDRGIRIVPELDTPGHSFALLTAYPTMKSEPLKDIDPENLDSAALNPTLPQTYVFLDRLYGEIAHLFPDAYIHVGGDEVRSEQWLRNPQIRAFMAAHGMTTTKELQAYFEQRIRTILRRHGKIMIGWDEVSEGRIQSDVVIEPWRSSKFTASASAQGHPVIVSAGYYIDLLMPVTKYYRTDPADPTANGLSPAQMDAIRKGPLANDVSDAFARDPAAHLTPEQSALILGAEAPNWSEIVSEEMLDGRLWPRAAAIAERFWSQASVRDTDDMVRRLAAVDDGLNIQGLEEQGNRLRMVERLAPGRAAPVLALVDVVSPTRNYTHNHKIPVPPGGGAAPLQLLDTVADAASTDSFTALAFERDARAYCAGDTSRAAGLRERLTSWVANAPQFAAVADGRPILQAALPASETLASLAQTGLLALTALERHHPMKRVRRVASVELLDAQDRTEAASDDIRSDPTVKQPPADLLLAVTPGIRDLFNAAEALK